MANRLKVAIVHSIQTLRQQGWSCRRIARELGIHRETVARYVRLDAAAGKPANPAPGGAGAAAAKPANATPGNLGPPSRCAPYREVIEAGLERGLSAKRLWQDLVFERGFAGSYSSVKRFARRLGQARELPFRRLECAPGEEAQVDFGRGAPVVGSGGRRRYPHAFRIVLSHSRKGYSEVVARQTTEEFIRVLENAFWTFGGVPRTVVIDNLRAAVSQADWYDPELNPKVQAFCAHYGTVILPTKPYTPRHKGKVESGIKYLRDNALKGRVFDSLAAQNRHLEEWERQVADHRLHGTTKRQVGPCFADVERPALLALPAGRFPCFHEARRTVHRDAHVEVDKAYYSVPPEYLGRTVWVRWDGRLVRIFNDRLAPIAVHLKQEYGRFSTAPEHIASQKISGVERGAGYLLGRVARIGPQSLGWASAMLQDRGIAGVRVLQGLLAMTGKHPARELETACELARSHGAYRLKALRALIGRRTRQQEIRFAESHPLIRPLEVYGRHVRVSFAKENDGNHNGEFTALRADGGQEDQKEKSPASNRALPTVQPPAAALGSLSSVALSSGPALRSLSHDAPPVNTAERRRP
jgi:transposase